MSRSGNAPNGAPRSGNGPHEEFLELAALSTGGELTGEEREALHAHLAECPNCRQALTEFEAAAGIGIPLLHSYLANPEAPAILEEITDKKSFTTPLPLDRLSNEQATKEASSGLGIPRQSGHRSVVNWNYVWTSFAAAVALIAALGIYSYQFGKQRGQDVAQNLPQASDGRLEALEGKISDLGHERQALVAELKERDGKIDDLHRQLAEQATAISGMKNEQASLGKSLQNDLAEKEQGAQERATLVQKIDSLQASLQRTGAELDSLRQQRSQEQSRAESLEAQIRDLHGQIRDQEQALGKQQDLLAHDRDIRDLMGARDLYIAEVYDVADDGQTQKPYGRVFFTKGKSLIFYAYDLDQEPGRKAGRTFQAWGSHGLDRQQATSLGVFYEDNLTKKRWVLKFDEPKKLEQIDAVFVTVEPNGGSHKPSGKPLLFAYLKVEPNHP